MVLCDVTCMPAMRLEKGNSSQNQFQFELCVCLRFKHCVYKMSFVYLKANEQTKTICFKKSGMNQNISVQNNCRKPFFSEDVGKLCTIGGYFILWQFAPLARGLETCNFPHSHADSLDWKMSTPQNGIGHFPSSLYHYLREPCR